MQVEGAFLTPEMWKWVHDSVQADATLSEEGPTPLAGVAGPTSSVTAPAT